MRVILYPESLPTCGVGLWNGRPTMEGAGPNIVTNNADMAVVKQSPVPSQNAEPALHPAS
ncbi:hypothetical protein V3I01_09000 [Sphingomonas sp. gentR]|uniref:hypothetical protein n=1 Tax=unclassified Sphingomonas TaxID=196159 RepID=UPI0012EB18EB|nr:hypothetical protein [Sphingomonas sp. LK11]